MYIPVSKLLIGKKEREFVLEALERTEISGTAGKFLPCFESGFAAYCECEYGISTTSGTTALHLALATLGIGPGDEVLVSTFTNMATVFAVLYQGAKPVPIDIEPDTWNLNPRLLEEKITSRTKAIIVVHVYGHPVDMDPVLDIARKHNLFVVEDAAEAHGALYKKKKIGSLGDMSCFSFYANKILTTGEGGMVVTSNREFAERANLLRSFAYGKNERFMHDAVGFNYRMTNLQAAIGCAQLENIEAVINKKRDIASLYLKELAEVRGLQLPVEKSYAKNVYWMFHVVLRDAFEGGRRRVMSYLRDKGIGTREAFIPANAQKILIEQGLTKYNECPVANKVAENGFYLPSGPALTKKEQEYVMESLREVLR